MNENLFSRFKENIASIFCGELIFAFIAGSVAIGQETSKSDIDMLVVVSERNPISMEKFKQWYMDFHKLFALVPDAIYPGEVVTILELGNALGLVADMQPVKIISAKKIYDGVVWAGMLIGQSAGFIGNKNVFEKYSNQSHMVCNRWIAQLEIENPNHKTLDVLLKENIKYES